MTRKTRKASSGQQTEKLAELLEGYIVTWMYLNTNLGHHAIARKLNIGTQRVTKILLGVKKEKSRGR